jgi:hypothetical protein
MHPDIRQTRAIIIIIIIIIIETDSNDERMIHTASPKRSANGGDANPTSHLVIMELEVELTL